MTLKMFKQKIRFYKGLIIEIVETLCTICLYLERDGARSHNEYSKYMEGHFRALNMYSRTMRGLGE